MVAGSHRGASDNVGGDRRRVGGGLLYRPQVPPTPVSGVRLSSNDVVRPCDHAGASRRASSTSRGRRASPAPRRDHAGKQRQSHAGQQQSSDRGAHARRRGTTAAAALAAASNVVSQKSEASSNC